MFYATWMCTGPLGVGTRGEFSQLANAFLLLGIDFKYLRDLYSVPDVT